MLVCGDPFLECDFQVPTGRESVAGNLEQFNVYLLVVSVVKNVFFGSNYFLSTLFHDL